MRRVGQQHWKKSRWRSNTPTIKTSRNSVQPFVDPKRRCQSSIWGIWSSTPKLSITSLTHYCTDFLTWSTFGPQVQSQPGFVYYSKVQSILNLFKFSGSLLSHWDPQFVSMSVILISSKPSPLSEVNRWILIPLRGWHFSNHLNHSNISIWRLAREQMKKSFHCFDSNLEALLRWSSFKSTIDLWALGTLSIWLVLSLC